MPSKISRSFIKLILLITYFQFFSPFKTTAQEPENKGNATYLIANFGVNANFYSSNFIQLQGAKNCCNSFTNAFGLGYQANMGLEFEQLNPLLDYNYSLFFTAGISDISANYDQNRFLGYKLYDNQYKEVISHHILQPKISLGQIGFGAIVKNIITNNLNFKLGLNLGTAVSQSFSQYEEALSPNDFLFENNSRIIDKYEGDITNKNNIYLGVSLGVNYDFYKNKDYKIGGGIDFNYGLLNLYTDLNWKHYNSTASVNFAYNLTKPVIIQDSIIPEPIKEIITYTPKTYSLLPNISFMYSTTPPSEVVNNFPDVIAKKEQYITEQTLNNGDTINLVTYKKVYTSKYSLRPVIYFKKDKSEPIKEVYTNKNQQIETYNNIISEVVNVIKNSSYRVKLITYSTNEQDKSLINNRLDIVKSTIEKYADKKVDFDIENISKPTSSFKNDELLEENNKIEIQINKLNLDFVSYEVVNRTETFPMNLQISSLLTVKNDLPEFDVHNYKNSVQFLLNNKEAENISKVSTSDQKNTLTLDGIQTEKMPLINNLRVNFSIQNSYLDSNIFEKGQINISNNFIIHNTEKTTYIENFSGDKNSENAQIEDNSQYSEYLFALTGFDSEKIIFVNQAVKQNILTALENGKNIELLGMNDKIGSEERNAILASQRAVSAFKLIEQNLNQDRKLSKDNIAKILEQVKVNKLDDFYFDNNTPYGRTLNRGVLVRIFK